MTEQMPPDPSPGECPGCQHGTPIHSGHGFIVEEADERLRLAE